jgi:RNA polymerase sigma-70 factor (ECF subfamily)
VIVTLKAVGGSPFDSGDDSALVSALRAGDDRAFAFLLDRYHASLRRTALMYVPSRAVADEVVQETWLGVIKGIDRFEGRSSLKTWIFRILMNIARTRGVRETRAIPFAAAGGALSDGDEPAFDPDRFRPASDPYPFHWVSFPTPWEHEPAERLDAAETLAVVREALTRLPDAQREVVTLRDIEGWSSAEVCNALDITETNQRVLLHRGRSKLRAALELYFESTNL